MDELCLMGMLWFVIIGGALSVIICDFVAMGRLESFGGKVGLLLYIGLSSVVVYSYWMTITTPSYAPLDYVPPDCSEKELDEGKKLAPAKEATGIRDKFARAAVCSSSSLKVFVCFELTILFAWCWLYRIHLTK